MKCHFLSSLLIYACVFRSKMSFLVGFCLFFFVFCFVCFFVYQLANLCLLIREFNPLKFEVIIHRDRLTVAILLFVVRISCVFCSSYPPLVPSFVFSWFFFWMTHFDIFLVSFSVISIDTFFCVWLLWGLHITT